MDSLADRLQASLGDAFTIERELGGGGMSRVFMARDRALDRQVVVKTLDSEASASASAERFRREVKTIARLQHPHVVPLITAGGDDTLLWYVMPLAFGWMFREGVETRRQGASPSAAQASGALRVMAGAVRGNAPLTWLPVTYAYPFIRPASLDSALETVLRDGSFSGLESSATFARGNLAVTRGDFERAVEWLAVTESPRVPGAVRLAAARTAALGAWLGAMSPAAADAVLARARRNLGAVGGGAAAELEWLDGVIGIAQGDSGRVVRAASAIVDTTANARRLRASLPALWEERRTGKVDRLVAQEDTIMNGRAAFPTSSVISRLAIGRALTRAGDPKKAEHYLQWPDARFVDARPAALAFTFGPYISYQRGVAFQAAGDIARARFHLERFIDMVDRPTPAMKQQIDDAKTRLARLGGDVRR